MLAFGNLELGKEKKKKWKAARVITSQHASDNILVHAVCLLVGVMQVCWGWRYRLSKDGHFSPFPLILEPSCVQFFRATCLREAGWSHSKVSCCWANDALRWEETAGDVWGLGKWKHGKDAPSALTRALSASLDH